jgi:hypothetical protein
MPRAFKSLFGLGDLVYDDDFADVIGSVLGQFSSMTRGIPH